MRRSIFPLAGLGLALISACGEASAPDATAGGHSATLMEIEQAARNDRAGDAVARQADYLGVETRLLEGDLVSFLVSMRNVGEEADLSRYADCAAAQYAMIRGYGFARHVRTNVTERSATWKADAIYTISPSLPGGVQTLDAEVTVADCTRNGIPTV